MKRMSTRPRLFTRALAVAAALGWLPGCDADGGGRDSGESYRLWECSTGDDAVVTCSAAISARFGEPGAYACLDGEESAACPPEVALAAVQPEIEEASAADAFGQAPWACLLTGENERHCMKDLSRLADPESTDDPDPAEPDSSSPGGDTPDDRDSDTPGSGPDTADGQDGDPDGGGQDSGSVSEPEIPSDCDSASWETYFCQLATWSYRESGVDITFPCEVFDASASFDSTLPDVPAAQDSNENASCHEGEWTMRNRSWLDAVGQNCLDLNDPILVMCQQGTNYAPLSGACTATGSW